ncbi:unnamed protein product [Owenia fusiformis]|uniref:Cyclin-Q n=1 Tax=Owenia fusiformis TaxID=6347 RepID=A0A8J1XFX5_OWEFU|nr:unnamed protein product [Owenia fusiformis]
MTDENEVEKQHFQHIRFMFEASIKLNVSPIPLATACTLYHKFFHHCDITDYDPHMVATTSLYLAGKIEEEHLKLRDVINVCYRTLNKDEPPLEIGETYWTLRDGVVNFELFMMRVLKFQVKFIHPHKYVLHYYKSLSDWLHPQTVNHVPILTTAWALLRDSYHSDIILHHKAQHVAIAVLYLAFQCHGVDVPYDGEADTIWQQALCDGIRTKDIEYIVDRLIQTYDLEDNIYSIPSQPQRQSRIDTPMSDSSSQMSNPMEQVSIIPGF